MITVFHRRQAIRDVEDGLMYMLTRGFNREKASRLLRYMEYCAVGLSGVVVDMAVTGLFLGGGVWVVLANAAGFTTSNTWNFWINNRVTFSGEDGDTTSQYAAYFLGHAATFLAVRAPFVYVVVDLFGGQPLFSSLAAIFMASVLNFVISEKVFSRL